MNDTENPPLHNLAPAQRADAPGIRAGAPGIRAGALGIRAGALLAAGALVLSGCAAHPFPPVIHTGALRAADVALVRFTSSGDALRNLRAAATRSVGPRGFAAGARAGGRV